MKKLLIASCLFGIGLLAGCSDASKEVEKFADKACACKDAACAESVQKEFLAWAEKNQDARGDEARAKKAGERLMGCVMKAMGGGLKPKADAPATPPAGDPPAAPAGDPAAPAAPAGDPAAPAAPAGDQK